MSASPSGQSNGQPTPNGGPPRPSQFTRKPKVADPLRQPRKKIARAPNLPKGAAPPTISNRPVAPARGLYPVNGAAPPTNGAVPGQKFDGWTRQPTGRYQDFPLYTTKKALREGLRYHIIRFSSKTEVNPANPEEFIRPVTLHRRDPKQPPPGQVGKEDVVMDDVPMDSKEREKMEILKAEKDAKRAADLAQIAPSRNHPAQKKNMAFKGEKTSQVFRLDKTEEQKKASDLRYEEALPWHLEDAESKNTWVGNYEAALSDTNAMLVIDGGRFLMVPMEKWYKFTAKNKFRAFTIEEAEAQLNKKTKEARWVMQETEKKNATKAQPMHRLYTVKSESQTAKSANKSEMADMDELDFAEDDLFQDDDEQVTVEPNDDEESKETASKIKREQLNANIFDQANEALVEKELEKELEEMEEEKKLGKKTRKALTRREKNWIYETDSDHPYSESSEDDTSDEEKQKEIDKRKDEEAKNKQKDKATASASKLPSGASSKGTNTPSGRPKHTDATKGRPKNSLKRSGSPNLSESSGNESTRKKHKKKHTSSQPSGASTPISGTPAPTSLPGRKSSIIKLSVNTSKVSEIQSSTPKPSSALGGSMSDGEATGGEDGKKQKIKLRLKGSPSGSRAGSPEAPKGASSRAGSPLSPPAGSQSPGAGPIQAHEIVAALPADGISIGDLMKIFKARVGDGEGKTSKKDFIRFVKENSVYGDNKLLRPKPQ